MIDRLIKECKKNNRKAQSELFYQYKDILFALCLKYCSNTEEAEDILQESFVTIFKRINQYKSKGSFEGWMKRITINNAIDRYRKKSFTNIQVNEELIEDTETKINEFDFHFSLDELLQLIHELPTKYRLVFSLYELDDYSHKEISSLLKISEGASKANLHRAKATLKAKIESINKGRKKITVSNG
ncbi:RNA polymerase sigma factor [Aquimarina addita]|uniref:RNA polymerase sigma factor n=1 Tax=Aquimarina addita TaxID=870485 RepID=A0ABP7X9W6_9FLAO